MHDAARTRERTYIPLRSASLEVCASECGAQCCRAPGHFSLERVELVRLNHFAKELGLRFFVYADPEDPEWFHADHARNGGACAFLDRDTNRCRIYEWRPEACRKYPTVPEPRCRLWSEA